MNKTVKKLVTFFILLCIIVLIVLAVELFRKNSGGDGETDIKQTDTSPPDSPGTNTPDTAASPEVTDSPSDEDPQAEDTPPAQTKGELFEIPISGGKTLVLLVDTEKFEHYAMDIMGDMFIYLDSGGGPASLEISLVEGKEAILLAPAFLDNYIDYTGGEFFSEGTDKIAGSDVSGEHVIAKNNGETYEAWLVDIEGGVLAFIVNYWDSMQESAIYDMLDSLEIIAS